MHSEWVHKLDPYSRRALDEEDRALDVALRVEGDALDALKAAGLDVHSSAGPIVTGRVANREALARVAALPCVAEIQLSRPLREEK